MRFTKTVPYKLRRLIPMLGLAGATLFTACSKDDEPQHDVELKFFQGYAEEIEPDIIKQHADDPSVRTIYLSLVNGGNYTNFQTEDISALRNGLNKRLQIAPHKTRGKGNFRFVPGYATKPDSLWFVQQGWTVNKQNQK